jgi:hypothetical protein
MASLDDLWLTAARGHARRNYGVMNWTHGDEAALLSYADLGWSPRAAVAALFEPGFRCSGSLGGRNAL